MNSWYVGIKKYIFIVLQACDIVVETMVVIAFLYFFWNCDFLFFIFLQWRRKPIER